LILMVGLHPIAEGCSTAYYVLVTDGKHNAVLSKRNTMNLVLAFSASFGSHGIWIGGGSVGVLLVIIIVLLVLRR